MGIQPTEPKWLQKESFSRRSGRGVAGNRWQPRDAGTPCHHDASSERVNSKKAPPSPAEPFREPRALADDGLGRRIGLPLNGADEMPEPVAAAEAGHKDEGIILADQRPDAVFGLRPDMGGRLV